ncbi:MAG: glycosyltransferase N-terminal domain-containing protein, partial [Pseudomonadota bacterium]
KEHPTRYVEKQANGLASRPDGPLIWLHAVGLGEVLSLRGLIMRLAKLRPEMSFLVTSTTVASADVFAKNMPPRTIHQFLPIDGPSYRARFLDHFAPDLCIWAEQDLWPGFVDAMRQRGTPQAIVAARMDARSFRSHRQVRSLYRNLYDPMAMVTAQDASTARHLTELGAKPVVTGSLKPAAPVLSHDTAELQRLQSAVEGRMVWAVAPSHPADEQVAIAAHERLRSTVPSALLIIAPRFPDRRDDIAQNLDNKVPMRSRGQVPSADDSVWLCDTFGELGLVYRLTRAVLIGGTFDETEGHNPWEAAALQNVILHGPRTANFANDFGRLDQADAAIAVTDAADLADTLMQSDLHRLTQNATACIETASKQTDKLASDLLTLLDGA